MQKSEEVVNSYSRINSNIKLLGKNTVAMSRDGTAGHASCVPVRCIL